MDILAKLIKIFHSAGLHCSAKINEGLGDAARLAAQLAEPGGRGRPVHAQVENELTFRFRQPSGLASANY